MRVYVDTNVFIDSLENRVNKYNRNIGSFAFNFFLETINCKFELVVSSWTKKELNKYVSNTEVFFELIKSKVFEVDYDSFDVSKALDLSKDNFNDALHVVIAERENVDFIVTRNVKDFEVLSKNIKVVRPEDLL